MLVHGVHGDQLPEDDLTEEELEVYGVDWEGLGDERLLHSQRANNPTNEGWNSWVGLNTGIPWVRFSNTAPVPLYTVTHHGCDPYLTVIHAVSNETCGTFGTRGFLSLKILYIGIKYI